MGSRSINERGEEFMVFCTRLRVGTGPTAGMKNVAFFWVQCMESKCMPIVSGDAKFWGGCNDNYINIMMRHQRGKLEPMTI
jgi:hypothetical protein